MEDVNQDAYVNEMLVLLQTENGEQIALPISALPSEAVSGEEGQVIMVEESATDQQEIILESQQEIPQVQLAPLTQLPSGLESETMTIVSSEHIPMEHYNEAGQHLEEKNQEEKNHEEKNHEEIHHHIDQLGTSGTNMLSNSTKTYSRKTICHNNSNTMTLQKTVSIVNESSINIEDQATLDTTDHSTTITMIDPEQSSIIDSAAITETEQSNVADLPAFVTSIEQTNITDSPAIINNLEETTNTELPAIVPNPEDTNNTDLVAIVTNSEETASIDTAAIVEDPEETNSTNSAAINENPEEKTDSTNSVAIVTNPAAIKITDPVAQAMVASQVCTVESLDPPTKRPRRRKAEINTRPLYDEEGIIEFQEVQPYIEKPGKRPKKERRSITKTKTKTITKTKTKERKTSKKAETPDVEVEEEEEEQPIMTTTPDPSKSYSCKECGFSTDRINNLVIHMKDTCSFAKKRWQSEVEKLKNSLNHSKN